MVLSFGVVRLLDGLRPALVPGRRYWVHALWLVQKLLNHAFYWWGFLSFREGVAWTVASFLWILLVPGLLFLQATALVTTNPSAVDSWGVTTSSASVRGSSRWTSSSSCTPSPPHRSYGRSLGAPVACPSGRGPHNLDLGRRVREPSPPCDDRPCGACCSVARSRVAFLQAASFGVIMEGESLQRLSPEAA